MGEGTSCHQRITTRRSPEARAGLERLATFGRVLRRTASATTTYAHGEVDGLRVLTLEATSESIDPQALGGRGPFDVALMAPIADEMPAGVVEVLAHVALNLFTNYVNVAFDVPVDFPAVALRPRA